MPIEAVDDVPQKEEAKDRVKCDYCGAEMRKVHACYLCVRCGQKKCMEDIT